DPDTYRVEGSFLDAAGNLITLDQPFNIGADVSVGSLFTTAALTTPGLVGRYVDQSLQSDTAQDDWTQTQPSAGTRVDPVVTFNTESFGVRSEVGITGGTDIDWDNFS